jgi:hypothetical protein
VAIRSAVKDVELTGQQVARVEIEAQTMAEYA